MFTVYRFVTSKFPDWVLHLDRSPYNFKFFNYVEHQEALFRLVWAVTGVGSTFSLGVHIPTLSGSCTPFTEYSKPPWVTQWPTTLTTLLSVPSYADFCWPVGWLFQCSSCCSLFFCQQFLVCLTSAKGLLVYLKAGYKNWQDQSPDVERISAAFVFNRGLFLINVG